MKSRGHFDILLSDLKELLRSEYVRNKINQKKKFSLFIVIIMVLGIMTSCTIENKNKQANIKKIVKDSKNNNLEVKEEKNSNKQNDSSTESVDSEDEINKELINSEINDSNKDTESVSKEVSDKVVKNEHTKEEINSKPQEEEKTEEKASVNEKYVTLGDSQKDVIKKLGNPRNYDYDGRIKTMDYGKSEIYLAKVNNEFKVVGWNNRGDLKVSLGDKDIKAPPFTYGSSMEEVAKAMGTPYYIIAPYRDTFTYWKYNGGARVDFKNNKVICWSKGNGDLNVSLGEKKLMQLL